MALVFGKVPTQGTDRAFLFAYDELEFFINFPGAEAIAFLKHSQVGLC